MKIVGTIKEFAQILRACQYCVESGGCECCALRSICRSGDEANKPEECIEFEFVD